MFVSTVISWITLGSANRTAVVSKYLQMLDAANIL